MSAMVTPSKGKRFWKLAGLATLPALGGAFWFSQLSGKATPAEQDWVYPADDIIDLNYTNGKSSTYAIDIEAPAYAVYRILKQIGVQKSGSFSSEFLERVFARLPFYNHYEIQEEFQTPDAIQPGDIAGFDYQGMSMEWADVVPGKYLVQWVDTKNPPAAPGSYAFRFPFMKHYASAWCFYVIPLKGERCRLLNHWRVGFEPDNLYTRVANWLNIELVGGVMAHMQTFTSSGWRNSARNSSGTANSCVEFWEDGSSAPKPPPAAGTVLLCSRTPIRNGSATADAARRWQKSVPPSLTTPTGRPPNRATLGKILWTGTTTWTGASRNSAGMNKSAKNASAAICRDGASIRRRRATNHGHTARGSQPVLF